MMDPGTFSIGHDWWLASTTRPGYAVCSGEASDYVANPVDLTILAFATGWYGCAQAENIVMELLIHEVTGTGIDLEWWIWKRP